MTVRYMPHAESQHALQLVDGKVFEKIITKTINDGFRTVVGRKKEKHCKLCGYGE